MVKQIFRKISVQISVQISNKIKQYYSVDRKLALCMFSAIMTAIPDLAMASAEGAKNNITNKNNIAKFADSENMVLVDFPEENMVMIPDFAPSSTLAKPSVFSGATANKTANSSSGYVESGINAHKVSNNQGNWFGQFVQGEIKTDEQNIWRGYVQHQRAFDDEGAYASVGNVHNFDDRWFSDVTVGGGSSVSFLPKYRGDAALNHRFLPEKNLVGTFGATFAKANQTYKTTGLFLGTTYYFVEPWILQLGVRSELSNPGDKIGTSGFGAVTYGHNKDFYLTTRAGYAHEAYQLLGNNRNITNSFNSHNVGVNWRQWLDDDWGFNLGGEYYKNPTYKRFGGIVSVFKEFD